MSLEKGTLDQLRIDRTRAPRRDGRSWVGLLAIALAGMAALGAWFFLKKPSAVLVQTATARDVASGGGGSGARTLLNASGYVVARREATVSSKITGKVVEVMIEEGRRVEAGEVLARLDASNVQLNLSLAESQAAAARSALAETRVRLDEAQREARRVGQLFAEKIATDADRDRAESEVKSLVARLERLTAEALVRDREVALWQQQVDDTILRAPFAGIVTVKSAQPGEMISPVSAGGGFTRTGICTIVDMNSLEVEIDVNESFINRVEPNQRVEAVLDAYPEWRIPSKVIAIIPTADRQKATVKVRVGFDQLDSRILPEMGVKVAFQAVEKGGAGGGASGRATGVLAPKAAVRKVGGSDVVWVVREGRVERRAVKVGAVRGEEAVIEAGLAAGERMVVTGPAELSEGMGVTEGKR